MRLRTFLIAILTICIGYMLLQHYLLNNLVIM
jgi:hypothetical protein